MKGEARPRVGGDGVRCDMFFEDTSVLALAQWGSKKGRGVFCDNKAKDYKVWRTALLYYFTSD